MYMCACVMVSLGKLFTGVAATRVLICHCTYIYWPPGTSRDAKAGSQSWSSTTASTDTVILTPLWTKAPVMLCVAVQDASVSLVVTASLALSISVDPTVAVCEGQWVFKECENYEVERHNKQINYRVHFTWTWQLIEIVANSSYWWALYRLLKSNLTCEPHETPSQLKRMWHKI